MVQICTDINQKEEMLFWIGELTQTSPQQAERMLKQLHAHQKTGDTVTQ